jgi:hypothetical protein
MFRIPFEFDRRFGFGRFGKMQSKDSRQETQISSQAVGFLRRVPSISDILTGIPCTLARTRI